MFSPKADNDEQRLAKRLRSGDNAAMRTFYARYAGHLTAVCARYIADEEDLKDVLQDSLVSIFTHAGDFRYRGPGSLRAWATRIVVNESLRFLQVSRRLVFVPLTVDVAGPDDEAADPPLDRLMPDDVQQLVMRLPVGYRTVFNLYVFEGRSHRDIASLLGISESTSTSQLHRAKVLLGRYLKEVKGNDKKKTE